MSHAREARPEYGGVSNDESRTMEEHTVAHNLEPSDSTLKDHLCEKTDTPNEINKLGSGYKGNQVHGTNSSPYNTDTYNAANIGISTNEISGASCLFSTTGIIGVNPINALNKSSKSNQFQEAAQSNPNGETNSPNFLSREEHDFTRATKKTSTWTRLNRSKNTQ